MTCPTCGWLPPPLSLPPFPRFSELLSMNAPPLDAEVAGLRQIVQESSAYIDSLQSQIVKAQDTLSSLVALHETVSRRMADAKKILHPMRSLPQDILIEIFLSCTTIVDHHKMNWALTGFNFDSLSPLNHPWTISHVSRRWREIALSLPRLWSVIYLDFSRYTEFSPHQCSFMGSLLFERSATLDLCVNIASGEMDIGPCPLVPLLKESTTRWRTLYAHMSSPSLQSLSGCKFPLLQELGVRDENPGDLEDVPVNTFRDVPNVETLRVYAYDTDVEGYKTLGDFPWSKLLKLACYSFKLDSDFLPCLQQLTSIVELTINTDFITEELLDNLSGRSITLPAVKRLQVMNSEPEDDDLQKFLNIVRFPSIHCFTVIFAPSGPLYDTALDPHPDFHRISSLRVTCSMTEPSSRSEYIGGAKILLRFLGLMSGVEEFRLEDHSVTSEFLDGLAVAEDGVVLLPSLTILDLHACGFADHDEALNSMRSIVQSRTQNRLCRPLEKLLLPRENQLNDLIVDHIKGN